MGSAHRYEVDRQRPSWQSSEGEIAEVPNWATELFDTEIGPYKQGATESRESVEVDDATKDRLEKLGYL